MEAALANIDAKLAGAPDAFLFFRGGMDALKASWGLTAGAKGLTEKWFVDIANDPELGYAHRKILDVLGAQFCPMSRRFKEVHFTRIVKEAHLCTRRAKGYLDLLVRKNYLARSTDGYRVYYRAAPAPGGSY
jgi:hypothetical protein